ncbi:MAG: MerR family transcriptional regulator [Mucilaginibacter sp.]|nr:MerR family transcriptional regulator [Mucilaginibacter sp.]
MHYSISDLEQLSGVSTHNIRIWERRYNALQPLRTSGNTRFYDDEQLKRLLNIAGLHNSGYKISTACAMGKDEIESVLQREIDMTIVPEKRYEYYIAQIISNSLAYHEQKVMQLITQSFLQNGILETYKFVLYPLLVRVGLLWRNDTVCPSQEHFLSSIIRQKLYAVIDGFETRATAESNWLLFLPEDEDHDIGLLLASYLLRSAGNKVIYLGPKVPFSALSNTVYATHPENLLFFMTRIRPVPDAKEYVDRLARNFPGTQIYLSGNPKVLSEIPLPKGFHWLKDVREFEMIVKG